MAERRHPLEALAGHSPHCAAVTLETVPAMTRIIVRADHAAAVAIGDALGVALPTDPCRSSRAPDRAALWLGPDEWLVLADAGAALPVTHPGAAIVDVSHRDTAFAVSGQRATWAINAFCALDLHLSAFPVAACARTVLGKAEIVLWRIAEKNFHIEVSRSVAPYAWSCLEEARREFLG
jgi:heterotetrameric sarcosine oxidase gamma subunit